MRNFKDGLKPAIKKIRKHHPYLFWIAAAGVSLLVLAVSFYLYIAYLMPLPDIFADHGQHPSTKIFDRNGQLLYEVLDPEGGKKTFVPLKQIPKDFINATLAAEDSNFYSHPGVDFYAIGRALFFNVREQRIVSGGSTITQQLVRNITGAGPNRNLPDKILEAIYAVRISNVYSKDQILELYLNKIYYGNLAYGSQSAALTYFGKNIYDLDLTQQTFLAGLPQSPSRYNPYINFADAKKRQKYVLEQMVKNGFIKQESSDAAYEESIDLKSRKHAIKAPHFVNYVLNDLEETYGEEAVNYRGLQVKTTLDYNLQLQAERNVRQQVDVLQRNNVTNGALLSIDVKTGQILAWVGSYDYFNEKISGAVDMVTALRQPGSSIKPLNYLLAFEKGYTPATIIYDIPTQFETATGPYAPKNYDLDYHGPVRARTSLASSYNIPAVKTLDFNGIENFIAFLQKLGIETLTQAPQYYGLALTLGGGEVRMIDMAGAFNVLANYGDKLPNSDILEVKDANGAQLYQWKQPQENYVLGPEGRQHAYQIVDIISDPNARLPGFGEGSVLELTRPAAVKTGTTRNFRDNWTIGFTPQILTAVWVGNADATPMENVSGIDGAAPIWADFMEEAHKALPKLAFEKPQGIEEIAVCAISGKLPTDLCPETIYEKFVTGSEPKEKDDYYKMFNVLAANGHLVHDECLNDYPAAAVKQKVLVAYPAELQKWAAGKRLQLAAFEPCSKVSDYSSGYAGDDAVNTLDGLSIDNPANKDEYLIDYSLPLESQKIPFRITVPLNTASVKYYIDEKLVAEISQQPYTHLWLPVKGAHVLKAEAILDKGKTLSESVSFEVK